MKTFLAIAVLFLSQLTWAAPQMSRTFALYTAPLGPSIQGMINSINALVRQSGRQMTGVRELSRNGFGKLLGVQITHARTSPMCADPMPHDIAVAPLIGNVFTRANEIINLQAMANIKLVDFEITGQINIGKITNMRLYFCRE